jgi:hypothetical protein
VPNDALQCQCGEARLAMIVDTCPECGTKIWAYCATDKSVVRVKNWAGLAIQETWKRVVEEGNSPS